MDFATVVTVESTCFTNTQRKYRFIFNYGRPHVRPIDPKNWPVLKALSTSPKLVLERITKISQ
jgi:hypothetical protein